MNPEAISRNPVIFICVGTPSNDDGSADLTYIRQASEWIGQYMEKKTCVVIKSTVPVGTHEKVANWIRESQPRPIPFEVVSNPEFLREGSALQDGLYPDRIVIGSESETASRLLKIYIPRSIARF